LVLWVSGCASWNQIGVSEVPDHGKIRVTRTDGEREVLTEPRVIADTIKGKSGYVPVSVPVDDVDKVESRSTNVAGTVLLGLGLVVAAMAILVAVSGDIEPGLEY
jgi:hypothetical protein